MQDNAHTYFEGKKLITIDKLDEILGNGYTYINWIEEMEKYWKEDKIMDYFKDQQLYEFLHRIHQNDTTLKQLYNSGLF